MTAQNQIATFTREFLTMRYSSLVLTIPTDAPEQLRQRYLIYISCADNGKGLDITTGNALKTFYQWVQS
jgi:hypothetical protein